MPKNARCFGTDIMKGEGGEKYMRSKTKSDGSGHLSCTKWAQDKGIKGKVVKIEEAESGAGTSVFDPVLCELVYTWFAPKGAKILDPFAGGSVRGIIAAELGREYHGVDLSIRQIDANRDQAETICKGVKPTWYVGDSRDVDKIAPGEYDLLFTCPPYANLEIYSDDPQDISTLDYPAFLQAYRGIIQKSCMMLKDNRFAAVVVGDVRGKSGEYLNFVSDTIAAFKDAGMVYYNEAILVTVAGSLPIRVKKPFLSSRKLGKTHQNVLFFVKGNAKKATEYCGDVKLAELKEEGL